LKLVNRRLFNLLGPVTLTRGTVCGGAGQAAQDLDFGLRISHDVNDHANSRLMILWGRNPAATSLNLLPVIKKLNEAGRPVVLIDCVKTESAKLCDLHLAPRPGSDGDLALALSRILLESDAADMGFLENRCENLPAWKAMVLSETLSVRAGRCDLAPSAITDLARMIMENKPVSFVLGWGLHRWVNSHVTMRSIDALGAAAGSIGVSGGGVSQGFEEYQPYDRSVWGDHLQPEGRRRMYMPLLGEELEKADPMIEMAVITAGNPVAMLPDANLVRSGLSKIPFKVVAGHFLDDTARLADVFLPATTFAEEDDVVASYGHSFIAPVNKAIEPLGEARSDFDMFMGLGVRLGLKDYVKPRAEWLDLIMAPTYAMGVDLESIASDRKSVV
jgi:anaerobic selenocysteine-containing dehydrogenase